MRYKLILSLLLVLLIFTVSSQIPAKGESYKKEKYIGTVIAYDQLSSLVCISAAPCQLTLIVRIDGHDKNQTALRFIQVTYQYYGSNESDGGHPNPLVEGKRQWHLQLTRDSSCDVPVRDVTFTRDEVTGKDVANPIWRLVAGAENEKIPFGETLLCYRLKAGDYKPSKK